MITSASRGVFAFIPRNAASTGTCNNKPPRKCQQWDSNLKLFLGKKPKMLHFRRIIAVASFSLFFKPQFLDATVVLRSTLLKPWTRQISFPFFLPALDSRRRQLQPGLGGGIPAPDLIRLPAEHLDPDQGEFQLQAHLHRLRLLLQPTHHGRSRID